MFPRISCFAWSTWVLDAIEAVESFGSLVYAAVDGPVVALWVRILDPISLVGRRATELVYNNPTKTKQEAKKGKYTK